MTEFIRRWFGKGAAPGSAGARQERLAGAAVEPLPAAPEPVQPLADGELPRAAITILNYNGKQHLERCFASLAALRYPKDKLEVLLIDNASVDGSQEEIRERWPWVKLVENERNVGFSAGCNQGAKLARAAGVQVFLNNDMRVEPDWLRALVAPIVRGQAQATTAKMFSWDGKVMNSTGGGMNFHGIGIQKGYLEAPSKVHDQPAWSLFACGGAMAIDSAVFQSAGGFDEEFFAYYEDVDLGWRLWVLGHAIQYVPQAVCYHHHSSTSRTFPMETIRLLQVRNPLLACFKNYDDEHLRRILPAALALSILRTRLVSGIEDDAPFRIEHANPRASGVVGRLWEKARSSVQETYPLRREAVADLVGINDLLGNWEHWMERRALVQSRRRRPDAEILRLFHQPLWCIMDDPSYRALHQGCADFFGIERWFAASAAATVAAAGASKPDVAGAKGGAGAQGADKAGGKPRR